MKEIIVVVAVIMAVTCMSIKTAPAERLEIPGTGACEVMLNELARAFNAANANQEVVIPRSIGTKSAVENVIAEKASMARVARPLEGEETKHGLKYIVFAKDTITFATGEKVDIHSLTVSQLLDIFSGKVENWRQVGGMDSVIRVLIRQPGDSSLLIIQQNIKPFQELAYTDRAKILYHDYEMFDSLEKYKMAIGWGTFSAFIASKIIRPIGIEHIMPTPENVQSGKYRMTCDYALVFKERKLTELSRKFIDFLLSESAKQMMRKQGCVPTDGK